MAYRKYPQLSEARKRQLLVVLRRRYDVLERRKKVFGEQIAAAREKGLSVEEMAQALDLAPRTVGRWGSGGVQG